MTRNDEFKRKRNLFKIKKKQNQNHSWQSEMNEKLILYAEIGRCFENDWTPAVKLVSADDFFFDDFVVDNFDSFNRIEPIWICFNSRDLVDVVTDLQCGAIATILNQRSIWIFKWIFVSPLLDNQEVTKHLLSTAKCLWCIQKSLDPVHRPSALLHSPVQSEYGN